MKHVKNLHKVTHYPVRDLTERASMTVCISEEINRVQQLFEDYDYLVVTNKDTAVGLITLKDLHRNPLKRNLFELANFSCKVKIDHSPQMVLNLMQITKRDYLLVFEEDNFLGVISLQKLTIWFANTLNHIRISYRKVLHELRNPIHEINGCVHLLKDYEFIEKEVITDHCQFSCNHALGILDELLLLESTYRYN